MTIGEKLKQARLEKGLSQASVAEHLNLTRQSISKWENDSGYPDLDNLVRLSDYYAISLDELLKEKEESQGDNPEGNESQQEPAILKKEDSRDEGLVLLLISLVACLLSPLGVLIGPIVLKRNKATNALHKGVVAAAVVCTLVGLFGVYAILSGVFHWGAPPTVEYLGSDTY